MDLSDFASVPSKVQEAISVFGHIDILVNCAGMSYRGKVASTVLDVHIKLMNVNYFGQIAITRGSHEIKVTAQSVFYIVYIYWTIHHIHLLQRY